MPRFTETTILHAAPGCLLLVTILLAGARPSDAEFEPPRVIYVANPQGAGTSNAVSRMYCIDKGLESSINMGDVLNVYREKRAIRGGPAVRVLIGTMRIQHAEPSFALGHFTASEAASASPSIRHLTPMKSDIVVPVEAIDSGVLFDPGRMSLKPDAATVFQKVADFVDQYAPDRLVIEGHTDSDGDAGTNQELSEARAEAVRQYLIETYDFITSAMVESRGFGGGRPMVPNDTPENKALNQRIEVIVWD